MMKNLVTTKKTVASLKGGLVKSTLLLLLFMAGSCNMMYSPQEYFDKVALNTNMISRFGADYFYTYEKYIKGGGSADFNTCEKYLLNYSIASAEQNFKKVKDLYASKETEPMINASLDLYTYVLNSYKTDHLKIARMIDQKAPADTINNALAELDKKSYKTFAEKYEKLWGLAETYAKDHNITVKKMPF